MANVKKTDWLKKLTSKNNSDVDDEYEGNDDEDENGVQDVLSVLNIDLQTQIPDGVKTSGQMSNVQFRVSKPKGYLFDDVDVALDAAISSLKTYEKLIHKRDLDVHRLATEIDKKNTDYANLQFQVEAYRAKGKVVTDDDGNPVVVTGEVEVKDYNSLQEQYERLQLNQQELEGWISTAQPYIKELEDKVAALEEAANSTQVIPLPGAGSSEEEASTKDATIAELEQQVAALQTELQNAQTETQNASTTATTDQSAQGLSSDERQQFVALQQWAQEVQVKYAEMEAYVAELENANETAQQQVQDFQNELETTQSELGRIQEELSRAHSDLTSAQNQAVDVSPYEAQIQEAQERITVLESEIEQRDDYIESLSAWAAEVEQQAQTQDAPASYELAEHPEEHGSAGTVEAEEPQFAPQQQAHNEEVSQEPEDDEDAFTRALREVNDPEVEDGSIRRPVRSTGNYKSATPGSPLTSLPPGADINDYL